MNGELMKYVGSTDQLLSVKRVMFTEGVESGMNAVLCDNGLFNFCINVDRGMDLYSVKYKGVNLGATCKAGNPAPSLCFTQARKFHKSFNVGFLTTCGVDNISEAVEGAPMHGSLQVSPAETVGVERRWKGDTLNVRIFGEIVSASLFGERLRLIRTFETAYMSDNFTITDTLVNEGYQAENFYMMYHYNFGYPFLNETAYIEFPKGMTTLPRREKDKAEVPAMARMEKPSDDYFESVFFHKPKTQPVDVSVFSPKTGVKVKMSYESQILTDIVQWKSMRSGDYALGIEPATSWLDGFAKPATIKPQQEITNKFRFTATNFC